MTIDDFVRFCEHHAAHQVTLREDGLRLTWYTFPTIMVAVLFDEDGTAELLQVHGERQPPVYAFDGDSESQALLESWAQEARMGTAE